MNYDTRDERETSDPKLKISEGVQIGELMMAVSEERRLIRNTYKGWHIKCNQVQYIIHPKWYSLWKEYVGYDEEDDDGEESREYGQKPGPIDNAPLVV